LNVHGHMPLHGYVRYVTKKSLCTSLECLGVDGLAQNLGSTFGTLRTRLYDEKFDPTPAPDELAHVSQH
jgi:hypothetical protein